MKDVKVFGHFPADTDSTCSPIVYAWYLSNYENQPATAYITGSINKEAKFVLDYFNLETPEQLPALDEDDKVVVIDTNNPEELPETLTKAEIIEIVDHHKLFGIKTNKPVKVTIREYGSVPTVIWEIMKDETRQNLPKHIAGLMLAPILSDTLNFTSSTTTAKDKQVASSLAKIAGIDPEGFATEMFKAKSSLEGMSVRDILLTDHKNFEFGGQKYKLGVLETVLPELALGMIDQLRPEIEQIKSEENLAGFFFFIVDIINTKAMLIRTAPEADIARKVFGSEFEGDIMTLDGVVSRKKQIVPKFAEVLD